MAVHLLMASFVMHAYSYDSILLLLCFICIDNTIPRNKAILQNQVLKTNYKQVTSVTETINILGTGQLHDLAGMPPQLISTKKSSYNEDKSNTETTNNQTDATSTMATEYNMKPVDVKDGSTSISNDGKPFPETSSRIGHIDPISHPGGQENNAINLPSNEKGISHSGDTCSALLKQVQDVNNELKQKVQKYEDERDSFFQREKDKLERDRNTLEKKEEEFERLMKVAKEKLEEDRKQLQNVREEQENDFNLKRQRSETELQEGIKKQKIEFEKQEKKQKRNANAEKKKISITENELDKKKEQLKLFEANLNDEKLKLNNGKKWVIDELNTKRFKLRKRHKRKQRLDEQEPVRKDEERVHKSSRKVKDKREWFWDENTILQQRKQRQNEENPRASVTN